MNCSLLNPEPPRSSGCWTLQTAESVPSLQLQGKISHGMDCAPDGTSQHPPFRKDPIEMARQSILILMLMFPATDLAAQGLPIPTTLEDWLQPGTQPGALLEPIIAGSACNLCHSSFSTAPVDRWRSSIMAQAGRDPLFHACLAIAEQDAGAAGDLCLRCHTPGAWLAGNSVPTDGSAVSVICATG